MTSTLDVTDTRRRLVEAAGEIFAEVGFRAATVREIAAKAGANVAAVNYHFGGKEGLYAALLEHSAKAALEKYPPYGGLGPGSPPEARLRAFVLNFLHRVFDVGVQACQGKLMAREMIEPTAALDTIVRQLIRPMHERLVRVVREIVGPRVPESRVRLCARSVVGQCLFYKHAEPVLRRLDGSGKRGPREIEELADHVTAFSLNALRAISRKGAAR